MVVLLLLSYGCEKKDASEQAKECVLDFLNACHEGKTEDFKNYVTQDVMDYYNSLPSYFFGEDYESFDEELKSEIQSFISKSISSGYQSYEIKEIQPLDDKSFKVIASVEGVSNDTLYTQEEFLSYLETLPEEPLSSMNDTQLTSYFVKQNIDFILIKLEKAIEEKDFITMDETYTVINKNNTWKISY